MNEKYSALFTPWKIGNVEIKNRIVQPSMGGTSLFGWLEPCHFDKEAAYHILNRAQNNVGLVLPGMQCVRDTMGGRWLYQNKKMFKDLSVYMKEFHKTGSKLFIQLAAGMGRSMAITKPMVTLLKHPLLGKLASPIADLDYITASASATPNRWYDEIKSRPMTIKEIHDQVDALCMLDTLYTEHTLDIDNSDSSKLDKMSRNIRCRSYKCLITDSADFNYIITDKTVSTFDQLQSRLTLTKATVSGNHDTLTIYVQQNRMNGNTRCKLHMQPLYNLMHEVRRRLGSISQNWDSTSFSGLDDIIIWLDITAEDQTRNLECK